MKVALCHHSGHDAMRRCRNDLVAGKVAEPIVFCSKGKPWFSLIIRNVSALYVRFFIVIVGLLETVELRYDLPW